MKRYKVEVRTFAYELFANSIEHAASLCRHWRGVRITRWPL